MNARRTNRPTPDPSSAFASRFGATAPERSGGGQEGNSANAHETLLPSWGGVRDGFSRRGFLKLTAIATVATAGRIAVTGIRADESSLKPKPHYGGVIDTNVTLGRWPFRRVPLDETAALLARLRQRGVAQAWAGSFEGLWHRDLAGVNARLAEDCRRHGRGVLVPFGSVNPTLPGWEEDLRRCHEQHQMPGIRLHPNYHGYKLDEPVFAKLLIRAGQRGLIVQIAVSLEDERMQSALARVPEADLSPLPALLKIPPAPRVVVLNWYRTVKGVLLGKLAEAGEVCFDIATVEGVGGIANLLKQLPWERVLFGSHAPFFYFESARLKLRESGLTDAQLRMICAANARRLLPSRHAG